MVLFAVVFLTFFCLMVEAGERFPTGKAYMKRTIRRQDFLNIDLAKCVVDAWNFFIPNSVLYILNGLMWLAIIVIVEITLRLPAFIFFAIFLNPMAALQVDAVLSLFSLSFLLMILAPAVYGIYVASFRSLRTGTSVQFRYFFAAFSNEWYLRLVVHQLVLTVLLVVSFTFLVIPGIIISVLVIFSIPIYLEHRSVGVFGSFLLSTQVVLRQFWSCFTVTAIVISLNIIGFLTIFGWLISLPVSIILVIFAYNDIFEANTLHLPFDIDRLPERSRNASYQSLHSVRGHVNL